jgi:membrane protein implicated in regulation of membrane protease activity
MRQGLNRILPFFFVGLGLVAFVFGLVLLTYLLLFGVLLGLTLYLIKLIRAYFGWEKTTTKPKTQPKQGRTFDSDDWKRL